VQPESVPALVAALRRALLAAPPTPEQRKRRFERAKDFDVDRAADAYLTLFAKLAPQRKSRLLKFRTSSRT